MVMTSGRRGDGRREGEWGGWRWLMRAYKMRAQFETWKFENKAQSFIQLNALPELLPLQGHTGSSFSKMFRTFQVMQAIMVCRKECLSNYMQSLTSASANTQIFGKLKILLGFQMLIQGSR